MTMMFCINPVGFCLAFDGDVNNDYAGAGYFIAYALASGRVPSACTFGTHTKSGCPHMDLPGLTYTVKLNQVSTASSTNVLLG